MLQMRSRVENITLLYDTVQWPSWTQGGGPLYLRQVGPNGETEASGGEVPVPISVGDLIRDTGKEG